MYKVVVSRSAEKDLKRLSSTVFSRVAVKIDNLAEDPSPSGAKKLKGTQDELWRVRVGDYRIIYEIGDEVKLIDIRRTDTVKMFMTDKRFRFSISTLSPR